MIDAYGDPVALSQFRPGSRVVLVADVGDGRESDTTRLGSQGTIVASWADVQFEVVLDDQRRVSVSSNMLTEDDELPRHPCINRDGYEPDDTTERNHWDHGLGQP
jgi:hypothetical protein